MNKSKLAGRFDTEDVVRHFLDAVNSLKTVPAPPTCAYPAEGKRLPAQLQENHEQALELVEQDICSTISAEPRPVPGTRLEALTDPGSHFDEEEPEQIPAFQGAGNSGPIERQIEAPKTEHEISEKFYADDEFVERRPVTPEEELQALAHASMLEHLARKRDALFIGQIRQPRVREKARTTVASEALDARNERIESSAQTIRSEMLDSISREVLAKLPEWHSASDVKSGLFGQFRRIFSASESIKQTMPRQVKTELNRRIDQ